MLTKNEMFKLMNENPVFHLATAEGDQPRVRGMLLFRADDSGIIFHTSSAKDVFAQMKQNPKAELCFQGGNAQIRVSGTLEQVEDSTLREEIFAHPSRAFLQAWKERGIDGYLQIFRMKNGTATVWSMETNFDEKEFVTL